MQGANQHIRSSLGFSILPKDTSTCRTGESNQQPHKNKTLALPLSHSRPPSGRHLHITVTFRMFKKISVSVSVMQVTPPPSVTLEDPLSSPMFTWKASHSSWYLFIDKVLHVQSIPHGLMLQRKDKTEDIWYKRHKLYPQCLDVTPPSAWRSPAMLLQGTVLNRINWSDWIESSASIPAAAGPLIICLCGNRSKGAAL